MADNPGGGLASIRGIIENYDHLSNWLTSGAVAAVFSGLASVYDKLTGAAILLALFTSTSLAMSLWPVMLENGYGNLSWTLLFGMACGLAGATVLLTLIQIIRKKVIKKIGERADVLLGPDNQETK